MSSTESDEHPGVILIVDDDEDIREVLAMVLETRGFHTSTAVDGQAALQAMKNEKPALVLADLMMPNMSGAELLLSMKQNPDLFDVPVLLVTAWPANARELGAVELLTKPVDVDRLITSIKRYCH